MKKNAWLTAGLTLLLLLMGWPMSSSTVAAGGFEQGFKVPADSMKTSVYWYWI